MAGDDYGPSTYGDRFAEVYDAWIGGLAAPEVVEPVVSFLADLAGAGPALELGIGTGRIALPLAQRGVEVHGIDASRAMVRKLRQKRGGRAIPVTMGDFARMAVKGRFRLVYCVFNTIFAPTTQEAQIRCFQGVARHLTRDGTFVIEAFVPDVSRFDRGQCTGTLGLDPNSVKMEATVHDPARQVLRSTLVELTESGPKLYPLEIRYAWPSELDLMAEVAGLRLRSRWAAWKGEPFTAESRSHVSVYERAPRQPG